MKKIILSLLTLSLSFNSFAEEKINIVASIKPLQLVAKQLIGDMGEVEVLIPAGASPHHYNLKPSDMRKLSDTDLVVWVGPSLEQFLAKTLNRHDGAVLQLLKDEEAGHHDEHEEHHDHDKAHHEDGHEEEHHADAEHGHKEHDHDHHEHEKHHEEEHHAHESHAEEEHDEHHHDHGDNDPHLWMDPIVMISAADQIRDELVKKHPELKAKLDQNFASFKAEVTQADQSIQKQLSPYKDRGFIVFHDAFALFVEHYGLNQLAYFTFDPSQAPGAKKVAQLQSLIKSKNAVCVFSEPQFEAAIVKRVTAGTGVNKGELDPLAIAVKPEQGYTGFIKGLADSMENCLR